MPIIKQKLCRETGLAEAALQQPVGTTTMSETQQIDNVDALQR